MGSPAEQQLPLVKEVSAGKSYAFINGFYFDSYRVDKFFLKFTSFFKFVRSMLKTRKLFSSQILMLFSDWSPPLMRPVIIILSAYLVARLSWVVVQDVHLEDKTGASISLFLEEATDGLNLT